MQGPIAQVIALATHGNAVVEGTARFDRGAFFPGNSTFAFCEQVSFVDLEPADGGLRQLPFADDPARWFERLRSEDVRSLRLLHLPSGGQRIGEAQVSERMLVGFVGGGGRWLIEARRPEGADAWEARWEVGDRQRADQRIWRVTYGRIARDVSPPPWPTPDLPEIGRRLAGQLLEVARFARAREQPGFAAAFERALRCLDSERPLDEVFHRDLVPDGVLPLVAIRLLAAAQAAWVFGGMGSWNDLVFEGDAQARYERLSEDLYRLLNEAIVAGANAGLATPDAPDAPVVPGVPDTDRRWWQFWR